MNQPQLPTPLFRLAFRSFFLFGALFSLLAMATWPLLLNGQLTLTPYGGLIFWHSHEMLFGFVCAIVVGFLLTAVQNWTGIPGLKGLPLALLWGLWLAGRLGALYDWPQPQWYLLIDLAFLPCAAFILGRPIVKVRQYRNLFFIPALLLLTLANGLMHASLYTEHTHWISQGSGLAIWVVVFIMSVLGGRVIPMFTANGTRTPKVTPIAWLEKLTLGSTLLLVLLHTLNLQQLLPAPWLAALFFCAGLAHAARWLRWRFWVALKTPLVWSLHTAYGFIPLGLLAFGWAQLSSSAIATTTLLHFFTAGAMGSLIIAMMTRVSLGHSGRALQPHPAMPLAFVCMLFAGLTRSLLVIVFPQWYGPLINISSAFWVAAFGIFVTVYIPILSRPRIDGKSG